MKIVYLPTDDRPYCYGVVRRLKDLVPLEIAMPERPMLGNRFEGAALERLGSWVQGVASPGDALLLSLDALIYGGLVQGRETVDSRERVDAVCELLRMLRQRIGPSGKIVLFFVWKRLWGNLVHPDDMEKMKQAEATSRRLEQALEKRGESIAVFLRMLRRGARVPEGLDVGQVAQLARLRSAQRRDLLTILDLKTEVIDQVHLAREDNNGRGFYALEVASLVAEAKQRRVPMSSAEGGDESGMVLLAGMISRFAPKSSYAVGVNIANRENLEVSPTYEGRPFGETLQMLRQLAGIASAAGSSTSPENYLNISFTGEIQRGDPLLNVLHDRPPNPPPMDWLLERSVPAKKISRRYLRVDLSHINGVSEKLVTWLAGETELPLLVIQSGTMANRAGYGLFAASVVRYPLEMKVPEPVKWRRLAEVTVATYLEEVVYNGYLRTWAMSKWGGLEPSDEATLMSAEREFSDAAFAFASRKFNGLSFLERPLTIEAVRLRLPWKRWFECEVEVTVKSP